MAKKLAWSIDLPAVLEPELKFDDGDVPSNILPFEEQRQRDITEARAYLAERSMAKPSAGFLERRGEGVGWVVIGTGVAFTLGSIPLLMISADSHFLMLFPLGFSVAHLSLPLLSGGKPPKIVRQLADHITQQRRKRLRDWAESHYRLEITEAHLDQIQNQLALRQSDTPPENHYRAESMLA